MRVEAVRATNGADLVGEADLERVERVVGVLRHLGALEWKPDHRRFDPVVKRLDRVAALLVELPDHGLRGRGEIRERGSFTEKFRIDGEAENRFLPTTRLELTSISGIRMFSAVPGSIVDRTTAV